MTINSNIWLVYSIAKVQGGVTRIPLGSLPPPDKDKKDPAAGSKEWNGM